MNAYEKIALANSVFTPGYPVQQKDFFSGRLNELNRTIEALSAPGRHPVIFGQRGVGKTSLANVLGQVLPNLFAVKISCDSNDTFVTIWNRILLSASVSFKKRAFGFGQGEAEKTISLADALGHDPSTAKPAEIADLLRKVSAFCVIILDEFDKVMDPSTKIAFADLIKIVSDTASNVTIILVGVAENIHELIGGHPSIDRNLVQIELPLMSNDEIREIFRTGLQRLGISVDENVLSQIPILSGGFPHYAHLLGLSAAKACALNDVIALKQAIFDVACNIAVDDAIEKYREAYGKATATTQSSRYPQILGACGYARTDSRGVFRATDVADALNEVFNESVSIQAVVPALGEFLKERRASVLKGVTIGGKTCYRFKDPMMRPFCRLKAREVLLTKHFAK